MTHLLFAASICFAISGPVKEWLIGVIASPAPATPLKSIVYSGAGVSGNSRSRSFPRMEASDSLPEFREWIFFIPFPFPNFGNGFFSFPSRSRILGMDFFHSLPFPNFGNGFFSFRIKRAPFKKAPVKKVAPVPLFSPWRLKVSTALISRQLFLNIYNETFLGITV